LGEWPEEKAERFIDRKHVAITEPPRLQPVRELETQQQEQANAWQPFFE
jgi:hypothetical protein